MAEHRQVAKTVLETIKATPTTTKAQAEAIVDSAFPGSGQKYLGWYLTWWYKYGITSAETYTALKNRIAAMDDTQFGYADGRMARLAEELTLDREAKQIMSLRIAELEELTEGFTPKTEPDDETLALWNAIDHPHIIYQQQMTELEMLRQAVEEDT